MNIQNLIKDNQNPGQPLARIILKPLLIIFSFAFASISLAQSTVTLQPSGGNNDGTDDGSALYGKDASFTEIPPLGRNDGSGTEGGMLLVNSPCNLGTLGLNPYSAYLQFSTEGMPSIGIQKAEIHVFTNVYFNNAGWPWSPGEYLISLRAVSSQWNEMTIIKGNEPSFEPTIVDSSTFTTVGNSLPAYEFQDWMIFDVTNLYKGWADGSIENHGVKIDLDTAICANGDLIRIDSSDSAESVRPKLVVYYAEQASADHYQCYQSKLARKSPKFQTFNVMLTDAFNTTLTSVTKPESICNPADKNDEGIIDDLTHLMAYQIVNAKVCSDTGLSCKYKWDCNRRASCIVPKVASQTNILVTNQLGTLLVDTLNPTRLLVPSAKSLEGVASLDDLADSTVSNYRCYNIKVKRNLCEADPAIKCRTDADCGELGPCNLGFPCNTTVSVADQFTDPAKTFMLSSPSRLCVPVSISGKQGQPNDNKVLCYPVKAVRGQPRHAQIKGISVSNEFGKLILDTIKEEELCVPNISIQPSIDADGDGYNSEEDCNDNDAEAYPGAPDICDMKDNNCDGEVDNDPSYFYVEWFPDADNDNYGLTSGVVLGCPTHPPYGYIGRAGDCDDTNPLVNPSVTEVCDGIDNDCDSMVDVNPADGFRYYLDNDQDGFGNYGYSIDACFLPDGYTTIDEDCNDYDNLINPSATEICDEIDNDCDGEVDEGECQSLIDADGDGFVIGVDCDDTNPNIHPSALEECDAIDNNCNGDIDENLIGAPTTCGVGACEAAGHAICSLGQWKNDCIPLPPIPEVCDDNIDNDCDGAIDEFNCQPD